MSCIVDASTGALRYRDGSRPQVSHVYPYRLQYSVWGVAYARGVAYTRARAGVTMHDHYGLLRTSHGTQVTKALASLVG